MDSASETLRASYDESPYPFNSYPQSSPGHLAAVAHLSGLDVPPISTARVLEIGSAVGGNVIPFAAEHPQAHVVGIDLSPVQTERAQRYARGAGLENLTLLAADIRDVDAAGLGTFDYVICHGVYSWVPDEVRDAVLALIEQVLAPTGVAYVSYNVYPGWKSKEIVREAMLLATADAHTAQDRVRLARDMATFLESSALAGGNSARAVADHRSSVAAEADYYLLHEELELFNAPCYFTDFAKKAAAHGLVYLTEAELEYTFPDNFAAGLAGRLVAQCGDDRVLREQYLDLAINRSFRQSLLVRAERASHTRTSLSPNDFKDLHFATWLPPVEGETRLDGSAQEFRGIGVQGLVTSDPVHKVALDVLNAAWPWTLSRAELVDSVQVSLPFPRGAETLEARIDGLLSDLITHGQVRYRLEQVRAQCDSNLRLDEPARGLAAVTRDDEVAYSFTAWHETLVLEALDRYLLPLLDGTRDREELIDIMVGHARSGAIGFQRAGRLLSDDGDLRAVIGDQIDQLPYRLAGLRLSESDGESFEQPQPDTA